MSDHDAARESLQSRYDYPLPEYGQWHEYDQSVGYIKHLCRVRVDGVEYGTFWPNAGVFDDGHNRFTEDRVTHIYYLTDSDDDAYMEGLHQRIMARDAAEKAIAEDNDRANKIRGEAKRIRDTENSQRKQSAAEAKRLRRAAKRATHATL